MKEAQLHEADDDFDPEYEEALKQYFLQCLVMEGSKILLFLLVFGYMRLLPEFLAALLALMVVRCNGGGIHCKHYVSCLLVSFGVIGASMLLGIAAPVAKPYSPAILLACAAAGYQLVPIVSENRPEPDEALVRRSKLHTLYVMLFYTFLICICPYSRYLNIGTWTMIIHILQLLLAKSIQRRS